LDNITHTLFALTLSRTPLGRAGRGTTAALVVASNAPDVDIVAAARGSASYLAWHRGPTHGPLGILGLGVASAGLVWLIRNAMDRRRRPPTDPQTGNATFAMLAAIAIIGTVFHVLMDLPTSYGTRLLSPFSWTWYAVDWMPIIDIYLLVALVAGLLFGEMSKSSQRRLAAIVLTIMAANYGVRAAAHRQAISLAPRLFGPRLPPPCEAAGATPAGERGGWLDSWPRPRPAIAEGARPCLVEIAAMPTFLSPFRWRIVAQLSNAYELHDLDVLDARFRSSSSADVFWRRATRYPNVWNAATVAAARTHVAQTFLGFSRFPAARSFVDPEGAATVRWSDMRFVVGVMDEARPPNLFNVVVRIAPDGRIVEERLGAP
jgi:membrane-bound metal-dependent hydrolase YbcI (DUF457 family)